MDFLIKRIVFSLLFILSLVSCEFADNLLGEQANIDSDHAPSISDDSNTDDVIPFTPLRQVYSFTGSDQTVEVPSGATVLTVKVWGSGGGGGRGYSNILNHGGAGSYSEARFNVNDLVSTNLIAVVGEGGEVWNGATAQTSPYLNGGAAGSGTCNQGRSASGGGLVGLFSDSINQTNALIISGSGGGSSNSNGAIDQNFTSNGGVGGTHTLLATAGDNSIQNGGVFGGGAGSSTAGGAGGGSSGGALTGGSGRNSNSQPCGGGGGAGYFGGGGGGSGGGFADTPGGGGSGYISPLGTIINEVVSTDISTPNDTDPDYPGNQVGAGGAVDSDGGNGHIVLIWE